MRRTRLIMGLLLAATLAAGFSLWEPDRSRDELAHWLNDASRFVAVAGSDAHYRREGTPGAPVLLLLHGTSSSLHTWDGWVSRLADDYDIVRVDLPGFGLTGPRADRDYTVSAYVAFLERFVARLGLTQFTIAGNSLGGNIAWRFA
ncbi:MAG: alpha/beta fold hydrolase, partial [Pseudomonadota bacterium]